VADPGFLSGDAEPPEGSRGRVPGEWFGGEAPEKLSTFCDTTTI